MHFQIQRFSEPGGIIRGWVDPSHGYGDPYQLSATLRWLDPVSVEIMGLCEPLDPAMARAIKDACRAEEIRRILSLRIKDGRETKSWLRVGPQPKYLLPNRP